MIFCIRNIYVHISWYFFFILAWVIFTNKIESFFLCLLALILHELGHIILIYMLKEKINIFYILPFGFCCRLKNQNKISDKKMKKILLAGPVTSLAVSGLFIFWTKEFALVNFIIGLFNFVPIGHLDGGRIIKMAENK